MFGKTVLGVEGELFEDALDEAKAAKKVTVDTDLDAADLKKLVKRFKKIVAKEAGREFPQDAREQMDLAVEAVFNSWNTDRAKLYRRQERIPERPRHRGQHLLHGLRQPGPRLRHRRRLHPRPRQRPRGRLRRLPAERAGRGRRRGHPQHRAARGPGGHRQGLVRPAHDDHDDAGEALQGSLRHRVHHRARPAVDAPDPRRQAHRRRRLPHRHPARRPGPDRRGRGAPARHRRTSSPS